MPDRREAHDANRLRLVYVAGIPEWDGAAKITGSVWREGAEYPMVVKPNTKDALLIVEAANAYEDGRCV